MNDNTTIREMVRKLAGYEDLLFESAICTVSNINTTDNTCTCTPVDGSADFVGVQLSMSKSKGFLLVPTDGTIVTVTQVNDFDAFISMVSDVDQIYLNGESLGGLVKITEQTEKLNSLVSELQAELALIATGITGAGGAYTPGTLTIFDKSDYENDKVKQG